MRNAGEKYMNKFETEFGICAYNISFDNNVSITWKNYIERELNKTIKNLSISWKTHKDFINNRPKEEHNIDWMC